jgi:uncharacterized protein (DUF885 family)
MHDLLKAPRLRSLRPVLAVVFALQLAPAPAASAAEDPAQSAQLHALFDRTWEAWMRAYPEWATFVGDHRYGDRLTDASPAAEAERQAVERRTLEQALAIRREALAPKDQASLDVFVYSLREGVREQPYVGYRSMSLGSQFGFHGEFAQLLDASPVAQRAQVEQMLARMAAYPRRVDQEIARLREGLALGWVPPRSVLQRVLAQIDAQLVPQRDASPFFEPFLRLGADIPPAEQDALRRKARELIEEQVQPALRRLRTFVSDVYLPAAPANGALSRYPGGDAVYASRVMAHTTSDLSVAQIHALGLRQLARLRGEMEAVMKEVKFDGDFAAFIKFLNTDPRFFHTGPEALLAGYRDIAKRIDPELPRLFAELPRAPYGVRAMPSHSGVDRAEYYEPPSLDGTRAGWFVANPNAWRTRPIWSMETLTAHEAVPGHHLQSARAVELGELPKFRRGISFTAYSEGWALYAETLGFELGLYKDPYSRFGHLQMQAFRAARLVVDTGIHTMDWSRQQAIDFLVERTGLDSAFVGAEVDRYTSWPGQALAYMVGQVKIEALRDRAKAKLGARFDIRRFHMVLLDQGAVPLVLLEQVVDDWIAAEEVVVAKQKAAR